ncbi:phosphatase domain-containing protein [Palleronia sp. LCG004]|uniref:phosphatase domain-containing protein n=1 Tax=Palleronia sp. LCG004 TaxID=3079304 RepID=UPI0029423804|nr:phosphatase domain-containing protein [Palleronia sp. LCG004]WOI55393.1 phosphatase domain-containing protein [Palleronia sp. LCG004]
MAKPGRLHRLAIRAEAWFDRVRPRKVPDRPVLDSYRGYAIAGHGVVLRGRVLASLRRTTPDPGQSRWQNMREMASLFFTNEVAEVEVVAPSHGVASLSDPEGYVVMEVPVDLSRPGWHEVPLQIAGDPESRRNFRAMVPSPDARIGIVSDIDDTMLQTGAYSLARNLWTTFTGSATTRRIFPDAIVLMDHLSNHGRNPVFYVSSSPWNLHSFLERVFDRAGLVAGPMFLRDLGISETKFITGTHGDHKGDAIDRVLGANPGLDFVLIGDTGQHDAEVYLEACHRHAGRIRAIVLREPGPGPDTASREAMAAIRRLGVTVEHGSDFNGIAERLTAAGIRV